MQSSWRLKQCLFLITSAMTNLPPPEEKLHVTQCKFLSLRPQPALGCGVIRELHDIIDFRWQRGQEGQEQGGQLFSDEQRRLPLFVDYSAAIKG